ncbi:MAG: hypothetical protein ABI645_03520 [Pseudomonadota bacterium]
MKKLIVLTAGIALLISTMSASAAAPSPAPTCDRECLRGAITAYLHALVKHDVSKLPFAAKVRITEDSVEKTIDKVSLVNSITKLRGYRQDFLDEREGIAGSDVVVEESGAPVLLVVRMKIQDEKITELETVASRSKADGAIFNIDGLENTTAVMNFAPKKSQLNTREEMIKIALHYPAGLEAASFVKVDAPFTSVAYRLENGAMMAGPDCERNEGCKNIKTQPLGDGGNRGKVETRVAAVDERMGIVWLRMAWGGDRPPRDGGQPTKLAVWESFKIYEGQIHAVEAFMKNLPVALGSGWPQLNMER